MTDFAAEDNGDTQYVGDDVVAQCIELAHLKMALEKIQAKVTEAENKLKYRIGPYAAIAARTGEILATYKTTVSRRIDTRSLREDHPKIVEKYEKESAARRFLFKAEVIKNL